MQRTYRHRVRALGRIARLGREGKDHTALGVALKLGERLAGPGEPLGLIARPLGIVARLYGILPTTERNDASTDRYCQQFPDRQKENTQWASVALLLLEQLEVALGGGGLLGTPLLRGAASLKEGQIAGVEARAGALDPGFGIGKAQSTPQ
jgi:hypothetical protein